MTTTGERTPCPNCGAPGTPHPPRFSCRTQRVDGGLRVSEECRLRRERDEAREWAEECETARDAEHTYASIVKAENESMRRERDEARRALRLCVSVQEAAHEDEAKLRDELEAMRHVVDEYRKMYGDRETPRETVGIPKRVQTLDTERPPVEDSYLCADCRNQPCSCATPAPGEEP